MALRGLIFVGIALMSILAMGAFHYNYVLNVDYPYQVAVESHLWNAYYLPTPEAMIIELNLAKDGMREVGLNESMFAFWFTWEKTPNRQMAFQYTLLDEIIDRTQAIIDWREQSLEEDVEQFQDVYQAKIESVKDMMISSGSGPHEIIVDDIAQSSYLLNFHTPYYFGEMITLPLIGLFISNIIVGVALLFTKPSRYNGDEDINFEMYLGIAAIILLIIPLMLGLTWINMAG